jgi:hypothetical protein
LLGIAVALGLGLWSFANAGVGTATQEYAETVTEYGRFASDKFVVPSVAYDYANGATSANDVTIYIYNSGNLDTQIANAIVSCKDCEPDYTFNTLTLTVDDLNSDSITQPNESTDGIVSSKTLAHLDFDTGVAGDIFRDDYTYQIQVVSDTGAYQTTYQKFVQ